MGGLRGGGGLRAFIRETASVMAFLECVLNVAVRSGNGGFHFSVVHRSPRVPIAHR